jgi:carbonic anhydrase/acetyltransferase-like protein (isoleucine patch superfamily)
MIRHYVHRLINIWRRKTWSGDRYARWQGATVGDGCRILSPVFPEPYLVAIGDRVTISTNVTLLTHDGSTWLFRDKKGRRFQFARIEIGNDVFIGAGSIILPGVRIGNRVVVGAGSVVTRSIPSGCVVAGNPARWLGKYDNLEDRAFRSLPTLADMGVEQTREGIERIVQATFRPDIDIDLPR